MALTSAEEIELKKATDAVHTMARMMIEDDISPLAVCTALASELTFIIRALPASPSRDDLCKLFSDTILKNIGA
jgi:hypothetical protein